MRFKSSFIKDREMWCVPMSINWLFKINLNDWSIENVCDLGSDDTYHIDYIYLYKNVVWCVTSTGVKVIGYHMLTGKIEHFYLPGEEYRRNRGTVLLGGKLWILPIELPGKMIAFDMEKKSFTIHESWEKECLKWKVTGRAKSFCNVKSIIYLSLPNECKIIKYDLEEEMMNVKQLPGQYGLWCIFLAQSNIFVTSSVKRMLFQWDEKTDEIKRYDCPYQMDKPYARGMEIKDEILLIDDKAIDILNIETGEISPYDKISIKLKAHYDSASTLPLFYDFVKYHTKYFLMPWFADCLLEFNGERKEWTGHILKISDDLFFREYVVKRMNANNLNDEGVLFVKGFIKYVLTVCNMEGKQELNKRIGYEIYKNILMN